MNIMAEVEPEISCVSIGSMENCGEFICIHPEPSPNRQHVYDNVLLYVEDGDIHVRMWENEDESTFRDFRISERFFMNEPWLVPFLMNFYDYMPECIKVALARLLLT